MRNLRFQQMKNLSRLLCTNQARSNLMPRIHSGLVPPKFNLLAQSINSKLLFSRPFSTAEEAVTKKDEQPEASTDETSEPTAEVSGQKRDPMDRSREIAFDVSIRYLKSRSYQKAYANEEVWRSYVRNHKGVYAPKNTRKTCIRFRRLVTGNPCPICRDEYLVLDYRNVDLLQQFLSKETGKILPTMVTNLCRRKHDLLLVEIAKARDFGLLPLEHVSKKWNYKDYYPVEVLQNSEKV